MEAGFEISQQGVDPAELRQIVGVLATSDEVLLDEVFRGDGAEAGQTIRAHCTAGSQDPSGPGAERLRTDSVTCVILA